MDGFVLLELILSFSAFVTCNIDSRDTKKPEFTPADELNTIQNPTEFLPSANPITHSTVPASIEDNMMTTHSTNITQHSTIPTSITTNTNDNSTEYNHSIATTTPAANTSSHTTGNTTQHNHSTAATTQAANTTGNTTQHANQTTHSTATATPAANTTGNTTQHANQTTHSTATATPAANTTGNTTQHANQTTHSTATATPANTTVVTRGTVVPTLSPMPSPPPVLNYSVTLPNSSTNCIQASMGLELFVQNSDKKEYYFNIERDGTTSTGTCEEHKSNLNITFNKGLISITFKKSEDSYYISEIEALLKARSQGISYQGNKTNLQLFKTLLGCSFKCVTKQTVILTDNFQLRMINTQLQAFNIKDNKFGKVSECSVDYNTVAIAVGLTVVILIILGLIIYGIYLRFKSNGYQRI